MPFAKKQHKMFEAAAHSPKVAKKVGVPMDKAKKMAHEGVKKSEMKKMKK